MRKLPHPHQREPLANHLMTTYRFHTNEFPKAIIEKNQLNAMAKVKTAILKFLKKTVFYSLLNSDALSTMNKHLVIYSAK